MHTNNQLPGLPGSALKVAQQQHGVSWVGWWGGPTHYLVTPTRVEVELRLSWAVTIEQPREANPLKQGGAQMDFWSSKKCPDHDTANVCSFQTAL